MSLEQIPRDYPLSLFRDALRTNAIALGALLAAFYVAGIVVCFVTWSLPDARTFAVMPLFLVVMWFVRLAHPLFLATFCLYVAVLVLYLLRKDQRPLAWVALVALASLLSAPLVSPSELIGKAFPLLLRAALVGAALLAAGVVAFRHRERP